MLSRLKKSIKPFEKFNNLPLINLEKIVPEEYKDAVGGMKKAFSMLARADINPLSFHTYLIFFL